MSGGTVYLLWKTERVAASNEPTRIWSTPLTPDGLSVPSQVLSYELLSTFPTNWEQPIVESPSMMPAPGGFLLFYSASRWETPDYKVGVATCRDSHQPVLPHLLDAGARVERHDGRSRRASRLSRPERPLATGVRSVDESLRRLRQRRHVDPRARHRATPAASMYCRSRSPAAARIRRSADPLARGFSRRAEGGVRRIRRCAECGRRRRARRSRHPPLPPRRRCACSTRSEGGFRCCRRRWSG